MSLISLFYPFFRLKSLMIPDVWQDMLTAFLEANCLSCFMSLGNVFTGYQGFIQAILMSGRRHKTLDLLVSLKLNLHKILFEAYLNKNGLDILDMKSKSFFESILLESLFEFILLKRLHWKICQSESWKSENIPGLLCYLLSQSFSSFWKISLIAGKKSLLIGSF